MAYQRKTKPEENKGGRPPKTDEVTSELLTSGMATIAQIAQLFETDAKTLPKRLKSISPKGTRRGNKLYSIREAAAFIVTPGYEIEEFIRQMSPQELPVLLLKEFWNGQKARLEYETKLGNYWPTSDVVEYIGELMNTIRMTLLLLQDDVNREESLTDGQRKSIQRITDASIETMKKNVTEKFAGYHANATPSRPALASPVVADVVESSIDEDDDGNILAAADDEEEDHDI